MSYLFAIDQGTTGTTCLLIHQKTLNVIDKEKVDYEQIYPKPGWVEHNLNTIWKTVETATNHIFNRQPSIKRSDISAIGITNQRETTCAYNKKGEPLHHAIVWQDRRTQDFCLLHKDSFEKKYKRKTGLPLDPYFSGSKMNWLLNQSEAVRAAAKNHDLRLSTIDTFLLYKLTDGESFMTEPSNASRTMLMDLETFNWDEELLHFFGIELSFLPKIQNSFSQFGKTKNCSFLPDGIPIHAILGDQQSALFGQACVDEGDLKCTYGTGAFLLLHTGLKKIHSQTGLLTTAAFAHDGKKYYALEGSAYIAGAAVQWLRDNLKCIKTSPEVLDLALEVKDLSQMEHVQFLPFFTGIGTPYWQSNAKAAIVGITRDTHNGHIARACLEGIALSVNDSVQSFKKDFSELNDIRVDGGASQNDLLMQLQANFSAKKILRPKNTDTTAFGVALGCLVGMGEISLKELKKYWSLEREFLSEPQDYYKAKKSLWDETIKKLYFS